MSCVTATRTSGPMGHFEWQHVYRGLVGSGGQGGSCGQGGRGCSISIGWNNALVIKTQKKQHYPNVVSGCCGRRRELEEIRKSVQVHSSSDTRDLVD